jgi:putative DNA primase/helicase
MTSTQKQSDENPTAENLNGDTASQLPLTPPKPAEQPTPPAKHEDEVIRDLVALTPMDYDRQRKDAAKSLGVQVKTLDEKVKAARRADDTSESLPFPVVAAWPEPIVPADLLASIVTTINRFLILSPEEAMASALWVAHTYLVEQFQHSALLIVNGPEPECGKTLTQTVLGSMACRPLFAAHATPSALFRSIQAWRPTIFIDEGDRFLKDNPDLHGIFNAGFQRDGCLLRSESSGDSFTPRRFSVYSAKCIAGIALERHLPDATLSRGVILNLRRKRPDERVDRLRHAEDGIFDILSSQLTRFAADYGREIGRSRLTLPDSLGDRQQDSWEPLLAIAACAGAEWLARATAAALKLSDDGGSIETLGSQLLADIEEIFATEQSVDFGRAKLKVTKLSSADLTAALAGDDEAPWATWNRGKPLTPRQLAKLLSPYGIKSKTVRLGAHDTPKGYDLGQFADAFTRYRRPAAPEALPPHRHESPEPPPGKEIGVAETVSEIRHTIPKPPQRRAAATPEPLRGMERCGVADGIEGSADGESGDVPATADLETAGVGNGAPIGNADDSEDEPLPF